MRRILIAIAAVFVAAGMVVGAASGDADAGEYNGKFEAVPGGVNGKSECSFSGLDAPDELEQGFEDDDLFPRHVQSYGQLVSIGLKDVFPSPGQACRGNHAG